MATTLGELKDESKLFRGGVVPASMQKKQTIKEKKGGMLEVNH